MSRPPSPDSHYSLSDDPGAVHKIWKDGYEGPPMSVEVSEDVTIQVEALKTLTEAEIEEKVRQFEASSWG